MTDERPKRIGGLWKRESAAGAVWLSVSFKAADLRELLDQCDGEYLSLVGFKNRNKTEDRHPDFELFKSQPKSKGGSHATPPPRDEPDRGRQKSPPQQATPKSDDIPF